MCIDAAALNEPFCVSVMLIHQYVQTLEFKWHFQCWNIITWFCWIFKFTLSISTKHEAFFWTAKKKLSVAMLFLIVPWVYYKFGFKFGCTNMNLAWISSLLLKSRSERWKRDDALTNSKSKPSLEFIEFNTKVSSEKSNKLQSQRWYMHVLACIYY